MGVGIFNKIKRGLQNIWHRIGGFIQNKLPGLVDASRKIIGAVKPVTQFIPGVSNVVNTIDKGLGLVDRVGGIGRSLMNEVK